jgi:hypothetical protein
MLGPITAFREYIFRDVLPAFGNINERARQVAKDYYDRIRVQPAGESEIDMASAGDAAQEHALDWFDMMTSLRQSMINLLAAGLFHLMEQRLGALGQDVSFKTRPRDTQMEVVKAWYLEEVGVDFETLPSWGKVNELRLVANAVKHAEGSATNQLRKVRPELFTDSAHAKVFGHEDRAFGVPNRVAAPLSGDDFFVTEVLLRSYTEGAEAFFGEIANCFR